jgi:hypothetical protein
VSRANASMRAAAERGIGASGGECAGEVLGSYSE